MKLSRTQLYAGVLIAAAVVIAAATAIVALFVSGDGDSEPEVSGGPVTSITVTPAQRRESNSTGKT